MRLEINGVQAYPLQWPQGVPRAKSRSKSLFKTTIEKARTALIREVDLMGGKLPVISSDIKPRIDGSGGTAEPGDPGVAIYFQLKGRSMVFACDRWWNARDNMHALKLTIEAMRGIERWGGQELMDRAFSGFGALPAKTAGESWWSVLGVDGNASVEQVDTAYRAKLKTVHPDLPGGSEEATRRLNLARDQAKAVSR